MVENEGSNSNTPSGNPESDGDLNRALDQLRGQIDTGADKLKETLGSTIEHLGDFIGSADDTMNRIIDRVHHTAHRADEILGTAEQFADRLQDPASYIRKNPIGAVSVAVLVGMTIGIFLRRDRSVTRPKLHLAQHHH